MDFLQPGEVFEFFVEASFDYEKICQPEQNQVNGASRVEFSVIAPPEVELLARQVLVTLYTDEGDGQDNWILNFANPLPSGGETTRLVRYFARLREYAHAEIALGPASPSQFGNEYPAFGWTESQSSVECAGPCDRRFLASRLRSSLFINEHITERDCPVTFDSPRAGATYQVGQIVQIRWVETRSDLTFYFSEDGGETSHWIPVFDSKCLEWTVPDMPTETGRILTYACPGFPFAAESGVFRIERPVANDISSWGALKARFE